MFDTQLSQVIDHFAALMLPLLEEDLAREWTWKDHYEAHYAQHTVQIDKTLLAIGHAPRESKRLLRQIYAALAEVEGLMIGAEGKKEPAISATASSISERTEEIQGLLR